MLRSIGSPRVFGSRGRGVAEIPATELQPIKRSLGLLLLGASASGKSVIIKRLQGNAFPDHMIATMGIEQEVIKNKDGHAIRIQGSSGLKRFDDINLGAIITSKRFGINVFILALDASRWLAEKDKILFWCEHIKKYNSSAELILAINKIDLADGDLVGHIKAHFADVVDRIFAMSAKTGEGIASLKDYLVCKKAPIVSVGRRHTM